MSGRARHAARPSERSRRDLLEVGALAAAVFAFHVWWWYRNHEGVPWFIDESGYLSYALDHADAARADGLLGWLRSARDQAPYAPLVPALSSVLLLLDDDPFRTAALSMAAWAAALVVATWMLGRVVLPSRWALGVAAVVAGLPAVLVLSETYYFAVPAAACTAAGLACLVRSDWGLRLGPCVAAGALFGAGLLARTMVGGLLIGVAVAALVVLVRDRDGRRQRVLGFAAVAAVAALVAAPWYLAGLDAVLDHLRAPPPGNGGIRSASSGGALRVRGMRDLRLFVSEVLVPMALLGAAVLVLAIARRRRGARASSTVALLAIVAGAMAVVLVAANEAAGQWVPVLPVLAVLAGSVVASSGPAVRRTCVALALTVTAANVVHASRLVAWVEEPWAVDAGPLGRLFVADRRTLLEDQLTSLRGIDIDELRPVQTFVEAVVTKVSIEAHRADEPPVLLVTGGADALLNVNAIALTERLLLDGGLVVGAVPLEEASDEQLAAMLADPAAGQPNGILTIEPPRRAGPVRAEAHDQLVALLPRIDFEALDRHVLPDGRRAALWFRARADIPVSAPVG